MESTEKKDQMYQIIEAWEKSGELRETYCQRHGLTLSTFGYWRTKYLKDKGTVHKTHTGFLPMEVSLDTSLEICYPNGVRLRVPVGTALQQLHGLLQLG